MKNRTKSLFEEFPFRNGASLKNRIAMAPMTTWSANLDGTVSEAELEYYARRAKGPGLVITGCAYVTPNGVGFTNEFSAHDDAFIPSLKRLADAIKKGGAKAILQIFHAGNKANADLIDGKDVVSASVLKADEGPFNSGEVMSRSLSQDEIQEIITDFGAATRRAIQAGFDGVEIHGAHGFLIQNFLSPKFNQRTDAWGGSLCKRLAFPVAVVEEVRKVIKEDATNNFLLGYRFSPEESGVDGLKINDTLKLIDKLCWHGVDYLHASLPDVLKSGLSESHVNDLAIERIVTHVNNRLPLIAAGNIETPHQAVAVLRKGVSLVAIGKGMVINPDWVDLAMRGQLEEFEFELSKESIKGKSIPNSLWEIIKSTSGWFSLKTES